MSWTISKTGLPPGMFATRLATATSQLPMFAAGAAYDIASHVAKRAEVNAPIRTSLLRDSMEATVPQLTGSGWESVVKFRDGSASALNSVSGSSLAKYAPLMYLFLQPHGMFHRFQLGPLSAAQPDTPEGGVGGQWLIRAVQYNQPQHLQRLSEAVGKLFEKGRSPLPLRFSP